MRLSYYTFDGNGEAHTFTPSMIFFVLPQIYVLASELLFDFVILEYGPCGTYIRKVWENLASKFKMDN